jgi:PKD repeat protein
MIEARDANGDPLPSLRVLLALFVGGLESACGTLSRTDVTTGSDGRTAVVFTAPTVPLPQPECSNFNGAVTVAASPVGTNAQTANLFTAAIRLLTPPAGVAPTVTTFTVNFTMSPNPARVNQLVSFGDAGSISPGHTITAFDWDFGDGRTKFGASTSHDYGAPGTYRVRLTVTDDVGQVAFKDAIITITP